MHKKLKLLACLSFKPSFKYRKIIFQLSFCGKISQFVKILLDLFFMVKSLLFLLGHSLLVVMQKVVFDEIVGCSNFVENFRQKDNLVIDLMSSNMFACILLHVENSVIVHLSFDVFLSFIPVLLNKIQLFQIIVNSIRIYEIFWA